MSSPPVRMFEVPQAVSAIIVKSTATAPSDIPHNRMRPIAAPIPVTRNSTSTG